ERPHPHPDRSAVPPERSGRRPGGLRGRGHRRAATRRRPQGAGRVRLRQRPLDGGHALGDDAAQPAPLRPHPLDRHHRGAGHPGRARGAHLRRRAGREGLRPRARRPAGAGSGRRPLPRRAGGAGRRRPSGDRAAGRVPHRRRLRGAGAGHRRPHRARPPALAPAARRHRRGHRAEPGERAPAPRRQPGAAPEDPQGRSGPDRRRRGGRRVRGRHAGPGLPRPGVRPRRPLRGRRRGALRGHPVAARGPAADLLRPRPAAGARAADAGRRGRRLRRARGPLHARARLPAGVAHGPPGEDVLQPRGVLLRSRAPASGDDALRARGHPRRHARLRQGLDLPGRRRLRVQHAGRRRQRRHDGPRPLRGAERARRLLRRVHEQPAVRRDARLRLGADRLRLRVADGQAGRRAGHGPGGAALPQRDGGGLAHPHGTDRRQRGTGRGAAAPAGGHADAGDRGGARPAGHARRGVQHDPRRGRAARRRVRRRLQERGVLRGVRRLLHRPGAAGGRGRRGVRDGAHRRRRGGPGPGHRRTADRPHGAGRRAGHRAPQGHERRLGRVHVGVPADLRHRRRGQGRLRGRPGTGARPRRGADRPDGARPVPGRRHGGVRRRGDRRPAGRRARGRCGRGDRRVAPPAHRARRPGDRAGFRARAVRLLRAPRGGRRGHRAGADQGGRDGVHPGRRQGDQPAGGHRPDPGRHGTGSRAGGDGGDRDHRRQGAEPVVHRLPDPDHPRHAADAHRGARVRRSARALRAARGGGGAEHLLRSGRAGRDPGRDRPAADPRPRPPGAHHQHL
ncbi:MAG: Xanthine dehydrogenase, molybdenum binding subunit, partial [uncultured Blastococcus sp.]